MLSALNQMLFVVFHDVFLSLPDDPMPFQFQSCLLFLNTAGIFRIDLAIRFQGPPVGMTLALTTSDLIVVRTQSPHLKYEIQGDRRIPWGHPSSWCAARRIATRSAVALGQFSFILYSNSWYSPTVKNSTLRLSGLAQQQQGQVRSNR